MLSRAETSSRTQPSVFAINRRELDVRTSVISVEGELDLTTAPRLKWMLIDALEEGHTRLAVDLTSCTFMDSTALGVLVGVNRSPDLGAQLAIACEPGAVFRIFELSGMDGAFAIFPTLEEALTHARGNSA